MKTKVGRRLPSKTNDNTKDLDALYNHVQFMTDDLTNAITGGLKVNDGNLPFTLYKRSVASGTAFELSGYGATVVYSSSNMTGFKTNILQNGLLQVTMTFADTTSDCAFLVIGEPIK